MEAAGKTLVIDADAHVVESARTWEYMDPSERQYRPVPLEARELGNIDLRLEHMDRRGVDIQVLHNTIFIESVTERAAVEAALCKSWNRWLADIWRQAKGRLRWSCMAPTLSMTDALDQIRFAKERSQTEDPERQCPGAVRVVMWLQKKSC